MDLVQKSKRIKHSQGVALLPNFISTFLIGDWTTFWGVLDRRFGSSSGSLEEMLFCRLSTVKGVTVKPIVTESVIQVHVCQRYDSSEIAKYLGESFLTKKFSTAWTRPDHSSSSRSATSLPPSLSLSLSQPLERKHLFFSSLSWTLIRIQWLLFDKKIK